MKDPTLTKIATGIYQDACGRIASASYGGARRRKRFPRDTRVEFLQRWQIEQRAELEAAHATAAIAPQDWKRLTPSPDGWCYVYFIKDLHRVKIGRAVDLRQRFRGLQTAQARPLTLLLSIPAHAALEGAIQSRFAHLRERGEWFRLEPDLLAFIHAVQQGANPVALLWEPNGHLFTD